MNLRDIEFDIAYNICFCKKGDKVLLLHRVKPPNVNLWNGVGGKIEPGESLDQALAREVREETGIDVKEALDIFYGGVVTWLTGLVSNQKGMHAYVVELPNHVASWVKKDTKEGLLEWKAIDRVTNKDNKEVAENLPFFFPEMLKKEKPREYHCKYEEGVLKAFNIYPLM